MRSVSVSARMDHVDVDAVLLAEARQPLGEIRAGGIHRAADEKQRVGRARRAADDVDHAALGTPSASARTVCTAARRRNISARSRRGTLRPACRRNCRCFVAPALFTSTSQRPAFSFTNACSASQAASVFRSPAKVRGFGPELPISLAAASRLACEDAASTVCAPSRANDVRDRLADAAAAAGHHHDLVGKFPRHAFLEFSLRLLMCRKLCRPVPR